MTEKDNREKYVFISHSNKSGDKELTQRLYEYLTRNKVCCWYDGNLGNGKWARQIYNKILDASVFVLVASENSLTSPEVETEISMIREITKNDDHLFVPFIIDRYYFSMDRQKGAIGYYLGNNRYEGVVLSHYPDEQDAFAALLKMICPFVTALQNNPDDFKMAEDGTTLLEYAGNDGSVELPPYVKKVGEKAFKGNADLKKIIVPQNVQEIDEYAFYGCKNLAVAEGGAGLIKCHNTAFMGTFLFNNVENKVILGVQFGDDDAGEKAEVKEGVRIIADEAFVCGALKTVKLPEGLEYIGARAFEENIFLESVEIPSSVRAIGDKAFFGCVKLGKMVFDGEIVGETEKYVRNTELITKGDK